MDEPMCALRFVRTFNPENPIKLSTLRAVLMDFYNIVPNRADRIITELIDQGKITNTFGWITERTN